MDEAQGPRPRQEQATAGTGIPLIVPVPSPTAGPDAGGQEDAGAAPRFKAALGYYLSVDLRF